MKIKIFEKTFFFAVLLLLSLFPPAGAVSAGVTLVILDTRPPVVTVTNPVNNTAINIFNNTISGTVTDNIGISQVNLSLNDDVLYTWNSTGAFNKKVNYTANTTAVITITATDTSNNNVSETITVDVLPNTVSRTVTAIANVVETVDAKNETNTIVNFTTVQNVTGSINVTAGTSASAVGAVPMAGHGLEQDQQPIDRYLEINVSDSINAASGNISWAAITMYYSDADLDKNGSANITDLGDINESSLKFWWYCSNCPTESKWKVLETGNDYTSLGGPYVYEAGVDMPNNYVWANISRFGVYSIAGTIISAPPVSPPPVTPAPRGGGGISITRTETSVKAKESNITQKTESLQNLITTLKTDYLIDISNKVLMIYLNLIDSLMGEYNSAVIRRDWITADMTLDEIKEFQTKIDGLIPRVEVVSEETEGYGRVTPGEEPFLPFLLEFYNIKDVLEVATPEKVEKTYETVKDLSDQVNVDRSIKLIKITDKSTGRVSYQTNFEVEIQNKGKAVHDIKVVEFIPKSVASDIAQVAFSVTPSIIKSDPIVAWDIPELKNGETFSVKYVVKEKLDIKEVKPDFGRAIVYQEVEVVVKLDSSIWADRASYTAGETVNVEANISSLGDKILVTAVIGVEDKEGNLVQQLISKTLDLEKREYAFKTSWIASKAGNYRIVCDVRDVDGNKITSSSFPIKVVEKPKPVTPLAIGIIGVVLIAVLLSVIYTKKRGLK